VSNSYLFLQGIYIPANRVKIMQLVIFSDYDTHLHILLNSVVFVGGLRRWYNPPWFTEKVPSTRYDPTVLREAFERVSYSCLIH